MSRRMKDSGVEWIGEIPYDVELINNKYLLSYVKGKNPSSLNCEHIGLPYIGASDLEEPGCKHNYSNYCDEDLPKANNDDVLVLWDGARAGLIGTGHNGYISSTIVKVVPRVSYINKKFWYWYLRGFQSTLLDWVGGTTIPHMNRRYINDIFFIGFSMEEQQKIANFLDQKVAEIDHIIDQTKLSIEEYKKYKQSLITETVTKGLNPDVEMKDSGIEWIGEIPKAWKVFRGKVILTKLSRAVLENDDVITCFRDGEVTLRSNRREEGFTMADKEIGYQGIEPGDLVVHGMDGFAGSIGISDSRGKGSPVLNVLDTKQNKEYLMYYLRSMAYSDVFTAIATGIRVRSCDLRWNKIADLPFPIPALKEQEMIVKFINDKIIKTDRLIKEKEIHVKTFESYKKSLIYECVTGKREVQ